jgi:hypothetical protein
LKPKGQSPKIEAALWLAALQRLANSQCPGEVCISASQDGKKHYSETDVVASELNWLGY